MHRHSPITDLIGLATASSLGTATLSAALLKIQQSQASVVGPDWITLQLVGAITSLVMALVFVHRLLMKAKDETIAKVEGGHLAVIASKDETIRLITDDRARQEVEAAELRHALQSKEEFILQVLRAERGVMPGATTVELEGRLRERGAAG